MSRDPAYNRSASLVLLGVFVIILMFLLSWSFRNDNVLAGSFRLDDIQICDELDDNMKPLRIDRNLPADSRQVCLWFNYSKARDGDTLEILWKNDERIIQKDSFRLSEPNGFRAFYLLREDGSLLPSGNYSITLLCNGREKKIEQFNVAQITSQDMISDTEEEHPEEQSTGGV